jgi:hypothetical protein
MNPGDALFIGADGTSLTLVPPSSLKKIEVGVGIGIGIDWKVNQL